MMRRGLSLKKFSGEGCRVITNRRGDTVFVSKDGLRQFRYGKHEVKTLKRQYAHFEAYDKPYNSSGKLIEKAVVGVIY